MQFCFKIFYLFVATILLKALAMAQIPVEIFAGHKKTTADIMFFKFFKNKDAQNTDWLFFNRNRASIDYDMSSKTNLPQFGFTEAISYNNKKFYQIYLPLVDCKYYLHGRVSLM